MGIRRYGSTVLERWQRNTYQDFANSTRWLICPEGTGSEPMTDNWFGNSMYPSVWMSDYAIPDAVASYYCSSGGPKATTTVLGGAFHNFGRVKRSAEMVFLCEGGGRQFTFSKSSCPEQELANLGRKYATPDTVMRAFGHPGGNLNYLYFDGHVAASNSPPHEFSMYATPQSPYVANVDYRTYDGVVYPPKNGFAGFKARFGL